MAVASGETTFTVWAHRDGPEITHSSAIEGGRVTMLPWTKGNGVAVGEGLAELALGQPPLRVDIVGETKVGSAGDVPVWVLGPCGVIKALHSSILRVAEDRGARPLFPGVVGDNFKPHTAKHLGPNTLYAGMRLVLPDLAVVDVKGEVLQTIRLGA
ncbi:MAG TPA: hypothetical protein VLF69_04880 [Candidatus Saccharimonadales bacterium]|nr:hypothetical protein [Candidatus Saccharimonadales bacterium]